MKSEYKILLIGLLIVGVLDAFGSIASRQFNFNYSFLALISFIVYGTTGFFATRKKDTKTGVLFAAILGLFDATIGWEISILLDANIGDIDNEVTTELWIMTTVFMTGLAALSGLIGGRLTRIIK